MGFVLYKKSWDSKVYCICGKWLVAPLSHTPVLILYMWSESAGLGWVQPLKYSMQTLAVVQHLFRLRSSGSHYPYVHLCLCLCVCVLWVVCVGCWGLLQHIYILFCGTFSRHCGWHEATQPPTRLRLRRNMKTDVCRWRCDIYTISLCNLCVITMLSLKEMQLS